MSAQKQQYISYVKNNQLPPIQVVDKTLAERSLKHFIRQAWHIVEPSTEYVHGWHIDEVCEYLEAISRGEIRKLIINIPPRHMKSLTVSVFWPCWEWIDKPWMRWLFSSYAEDLSKRDSQKCRRIIQSPWYQQNWGDKVRVESDQNQKQRFENTATGVRIATSVNALGTGEGGNRIVVNDPHNVRDVEYEVKRISTLHWWDESMSTRINDPKIAAKIIIMHRSHENDLTGHILEKERNYVHLCLPARYEKDHPSRYVKDPRREEGELLWPERYGEKEQSDIEGEMGSYAVAGQMQQRPSPRGGGMFKVERFKIVNAITMAKVEKKVKYWDKAGTEGGGAYSAGVLMYRMKDKTYIIPDVQRGQWSAGEREARIRQTAEIDGKDVIVWVEQEPGSGGKESAEATVKNLAGFVIKAERVTGSKEARATPYAVQVEAGNVSLLKGEWNREFIDEHEKFPMGKYKDQVDAAAGAFNKLAESVRVGAW